MMRMLPVAALMLFATMQIDRQPAGDSTGPPRIVGYYPSWAVYGSYRVSDIPADDLTHINYAFANVSETGECTLGDAGADTDYPYPDADDAPFGGNLGALVRLKAEHPHLRTLISVGGWTWSGRFSDAALTPDSRARFARSCAEFMLRYGFDGVDVDWEYPTCGGDPGNVERPEDVENFVLLLQALRDALDSRGQLDGRHYLLTIAAGASRSAYERLDWARIHPLLDWVNVMTYDMSGSWSARTGFNAPLYDSADAPPEGTSTATALLGYLEQGIPPDKVVMGVPFYGRGWAGVPDDNQGLHQPFEGLPPGTSSPGVFDYDDLADHYVGRFQRFWHERAQVPWLYDAATGVMITYEDPDSLALKAAFVREHGLGGVMFWELSADPEGTLLAALHHALHGP